MKLAFLFLWLCVPVVWAAWHFGPGQDAIKRDRSDAALTIAKAEASSADYAAAIEGYDAALAALPKDDLAQSRRIRLARAKARMEAQQLPEAHRELQALYLELSDDAGVEREVMNGTREALATAMYYNTWLMRLEGQAREVWEPEIEGARQHFRFLAEQDVGVLTSADQKRSQTGLENAIKLARMDLAELQGLPLPCQCKGCCSNCKKAGKKPGQKKPQDSRAAGSGPPADGQGS